MIALGHGIATHHRPITTADVGPQEQDVPIIGPRGTLVRNCRSRPRDMKLSLEDKTDLKRAAFEQQLGGRNPYRVPRRPIPYRDHPKFRIRKSSNSITLAHDLVVVGL
ncbi:hypothetical protein BHE74_00021591 [Ensete ventricosum]|nr:hypothetical protein BHE74_00021591 [Ensete ventricosum]